MVADLHLEVAAEVGGSMDWEGDASGPAIDEAVAARLAAEVSPVEIALAGAALNTNAQAEYDATMRLQEQFVEAHLAELEGMVLEAGGDAE